MSKYIGKYKSDKCKVVKENRFLFWRSLETYYDHDWEYINYGSKEGVKTFGLKRVCKKCGRKEGYFGDTSTYGYFGEDWRKIK